MRSIEELRDGERKRIADHSPNCYAPWNCQSCGCVRSERIVCPSHAGNPMHMADQDARRNELLERIADALGVAKP